MCNDQYIPDDNDAVNELMDFAYQGPDNPDQEEANFYFVLNDFKDIVRRYGIDKVIKEMDQDTEDELYWYYWKNAQQKVSQEYEDEIKRLVFTPVDDDEVPF